MDAELSEDDEGKAVVDQDDQRIGTVYDVDFRTVQVAAESDPGEGARRLEERDGEVIYEIQDAQVTGVTDSEVRVDLDE